MVYYQPNCTVHQWGREIKGSMSEYTEFNPERKRTPFDGYERGFSVAQRTAHIHEMSCRFYGIHVMLTASESECWCVWCRFMRVTPLWCVSVVWCDVAASWSGRFLLWHLYFIVLPFVCIISSLSLALYFTCRWWGKVFCMCICFACAVCTIELRNWMKQMNEWMNE